MSNRKKIQVAKLGWKQCFEIWMRANDIFPQDTYIKDFLESQPIFTLNDTDTGGRINMDTQRAKPNNGDQIPVPKRLIGLRSHRRKRKNPKL